MGKNEGDSEEKVTYSPAKNKKSNENKVSKMYTVKLKRMPYISDPMLLPRVEDYMEENKGSEVDVDTMVDDLRKLYKDYSRKKRAPFRASVKKAFATVLKQQQFENMTDEEEEDDMLDALNEDIGLDDEDEDIGDEDEDEEEEEDDEDVSGLEDENEDEMEDDDDDMYSGSRSGQIRLSNKRLPSMKPAQRNGAAELINISSDESDGEPKKESTPTKVLARVKTNMSGKMIFNNSKAAKETHSHSSHNHLDSSSKKKQIIQNLSKTVASNSSNGNCTPKTAGGMFPIKTRVCADFSSVAGCDKVLQEIKQWLVHLRHPEVYQHLGVVGPRGFLLHGPPGTGKTLIARAIAGEMKFPLIQVAAPELIRGVSGSSEERIRMLFEQAASIAPCIVFLDEIDVITPNRENSQRDMERRIVAQLLSSIDDLNNTHNGNKILLIGATSRPDVIDPALRRSGRFDREISLGIPDRAGRKEILSLLTRRLKMVDVSLDELATNSPGFVGADLKALIIEAAMAAITRQYNGPKGKPSGSTVAATINDEEMPQAITAAKTDQDVGDPRNSSDKREAEDEDGPDLKKPKLSEESDGTKGDAISNDSNEKVIKVVKDGSSSKESDKEPENNADKSIEPITKTNSTDSNKSKDADDIDVINVEEYVIELSNLPSMNLSDLLRKNQALTFNEMKFLAIEMCDFRTAFKVVQPSAKREGFATVPDVTWDDVGSLKDIRNDLEMSIMGPIRYPEMYSSLGLSASTGVLLCGPPGCGKTLLAKAIANEAGINFISVKGPELLNMYVGESERGVRQCFMRARNSQPCVIFFDELDALCPKRSDSSDSNASMRVVNQLLTEMDGVEGRNGVFVLAATNRPDIIDPAVMRPGRLDKIIYVGLPSVTDRVDILKALTKNGTKPILDGDVSLDDISCQCRGFTGADLASLVREAGMQSMREYISCNKTGPTSIAGRHFEVALKKIRPSVSDEDQKHYESLRSKYAVISSDLVTNMEVNEEN